MFEEIKEIEEIEEELEFETKTVPNGSWCYLSEEDERRGDKYLLSDWYIVYPDKEEVLMSREVPNGWGYGYHEEYEEYEP